MRWNGTSCCESVGKSMVTETTTWLEFPDGGKVIVEQILGSEEINKSKRAGLWYYKNEIRFNGIFSRNNLLKKIKDEAYVINLDEYANTGTHWIALFCNKNTVIYFDSFGVEDISREI